MTTDDLIAAVKRKISFPVSQNTFSEDDIIQFANEEMFIAQVPSVLQYHEEYFVCRVQTPLVTNISRYQIPNRAIGMKLRDLMWSDSSGNYFEMTRVNSDDRAFFQRNVGANQAIHKFYLEGNDVVLTPGVVGGPTGSLNFFIYLRPNQLVSNSRARIINSFSRGINYDETKVNIGDKFTITTKNQTPNPVSYEFIAISDADTDIATITSGDSPVVTTVAAHNIPQGVMFRVQINGSIPSNANGLYSAVSTGPNTFKLSGSLAASASGGTYSIENSFQKTYVGYLISAITYAAIPEMISTELYASPEMLCTFSDITLSFSSNSEGISAESVIRFNFSSDITDLFNLNGAKSKVDLLQTNPGHRTYLFDLTLQNAVGSVGYFNYSDLLVYLSTGFGYAPQIIPIQIGDYMCLANEAIIPQIPPDLHNVLAERTAARILAAIGDQAGLAITNQKISEMENRQGNLLDQRSEGTPQKITARHSLLRYGKMGVRRRM